MVIGLDIDGTLTRYPEFFLELARLFRSNGHKVYLITGLGKNGWPPKLEKHKIDPQLFDGIIDTSEYNHAERLLIGQELDNEKIVGRFKQRRCQELGVDIMFDDMADVHQQFGPVPIFKVPKKP